MSIVQILVMKMQNTSHKRRLVIILSTILLWLCFTSIFIPPSNKTFYPTKVAERFEEYSNDVDLVTSSEELAKITTTMETSSIKTTGLPAVVFVPPIESETTTIPTTSTTTTRTTTTSTSSTQHTTTKDISYQRHINQNFGNNATNIEVHDTEYNNMKIIVNKNISKNNENSNLLSERPVRIGSVTSQKNTTIMTHDNGSNDVDSYEEDEKHDELSGTHHGESFRRVVGDYVEDYYEDAKYGPPLRRTQEPLDLSNYKKVYPRYKKPIDEEYLKTMVMVK